MFGRQYKGGDPFRNKHAWTNAPTLCSPACLLTRPWLHVA